MSLRRPLSLVALTALLAGGASAGAAPRPGDGPVDVVLTFDDGPNPGRTPRVLDELRGRGLRAVFFVNGRRFLGPSAEHQAGRALLRRMVDEGHLVANHTVHHHNLCRDHEHAAAEIDDNARLIEEATGLAPLAFRSPYGARCRSLARLLEARHLVDTRWTVDPQDWRSRTAASVRDGLVQQLRRARGRALVLVHDVQPGSVEALPAVLDWIDAERARRVARGQAPIRVVDYRSLLPPAELRDNGLLALGRRGLRAIEAAFWLPGPVASLR